MSQMDVNNSEVSLVKQFEVPPNSDFCNLLESAQQYEAHLEYQRNVLKHIIDVGASLRLSMDIDTLLKRVCVAACSALCFRYAVLYLSDNQGYFRACALSSDDPEEKV